MLLKIILTLLFFTISLAKENITIQLNWKYQFEFAGFIMAKEKGFYSREGLNVTLKEISKNRCVVDYVLNNPNTYGVGDSGLIYDILEKKPIEFLMPIYDSSPYVLTAINLPKLQSLKDIEKYHIVFDQFAMKNPAILAMLKSQNIDIKKLNIKKENFYKNIHQKGIFAFYESNEIYTLKKNKIFFQNFIPKNYGFDFYGDILFTSKKEVKNYPDRTLKVVNATKEGFIYAFNHIDETIDIIYKKYNSQHLSKEKLKYEAMILKEYLSKNFKFNFSKLKNIKNVYLLLGNVENVKLSDYLYNPLNFTEKEEQFIQNHIIKAIATSTWEPFNLLLDGKLSGIAIDYWRYIRQQTMLKSECFIVNDWSKVLKEIKTKNKDITCSTSISADRKKYALFSKPYVSFPIVIVTRNDVGFVSDISLVKDKIIAVGKHYTAEILLKKHYPNLKLLEVENSDEALSLVSKGEVFGAVDILPVMAYKINKYNYSNLKISGKTSFNFDVRFMVRKDYPELVSIINKVIDSMPQSKKEEIYRNWISVKYQRGYSHNYIQRIAIYISIVFLIILGLLFYLIENILQRKKLEEKLEELATIDKLTSVFNRYKIDMALGEQLEIAKRYKRDLSIIFFDIDHFKDVNDTYGHKAGDSVLIELSSIVSKNIRSSDIFGRWGGEEFLIILPETTIDKAEKLAEKLRKIINMHHFKRVGHISCSFGVTDYKNDDKIESIMERVDKILYFSKENGRNQVNTDSIFDNNNKK